MDRDDAVGRLVQDAVFPTCAIPDGVLDRARAAGRMRAPVGSRPLDFVYDSALDRALTRVTAREPIRLMTFAGSGLRLELRLDGDPGSRSVRGWTAPVPVVTALLITEFESALAVDVDLDGGIRAEGLSAVPTCLRIAVEAPSEVTYHSAWFLP